MPSAQSRSSDGTESKARRAPCHVLQALAAPFRYRVAQDPAGWPMIPGRLGRPEWHDEVALAVYSARPRLFARLWALPGIRRW